MELNFSIFVVIVAAFFVVSALGQQDDYRRPYSFPGTGSHSCRQVGICGGFVGARCPPGSVCRRDLWPNASAGPCCRVGSGPICPEPAGPCARWGQCRRGYTCQREPWSRFGTCCRNRRQGTCPPPSGRPGICVFDPRRNCISDRQCRRGQLCCSEGCGRVCTYPIYHDVY